MQAGILLAAQGAAALSRLQAWTIVAVVASAGAVAGSCATSGCRRSAPPSAHSAPSASIVAAAAHSSAASSSSPVASATASKAEPSDGGAEPLLSAAVPPPKPVGPPPRPAYSGPVPRTADTPRDAIIEQVRPLVEACFAAANRTGAGRVRIVLRLRPTGQTKSVDVTTTGTLPRSISACSRDRIERARFRVQADSPHLLSFPVILTRSP